MFYDVAIVCPWPVGGGPGGYYRLPGRCFSADLLGIMTVLFMGLGWVLRQRTLALERAGAKFNRMRDDSRNWRCCWSSVIRSCWKSRIMRYAWRLNERNRIAREIHDRGAYALRSILQVGALMALHRAAAQQGA